MDQVKLSDQQTCLERPANVLDSLVQKKQSEEFTNDVLDVPESQEKVREVRILQLDMSTRPEEEEEDSMSLRLGKELRIDITKTIIQDEPETRPEVQDTLSQTDLAKLHPSCQTTPEPKTELIEIQLFEQTGVEPRETEISKVLKEESSQDEDSSLSIHGNDTSLACLDEVISKKVPIGAEECVLYLDIKTTSEDQEHTLRETEITIDVVQADIQTERLNETSADSVVEHDMPEIKTEEQQSGCRDSGALMQISSDNTKMSLHPADVVTQTETAELMKTTQEGPAQVMEEEDVRERSTQILELEEKLVTIQREPDMPDSRENTSSNVEEHELVDQPIPQNEAVVDATDKILDKLESTTTHEEVQDSVSDFQSKNDPVTAERNVEQPPLTMEEDEQRERNVTMETPLEVIEKEPQTEEISGTDRTTPSAECEVPHLGESFHMKSEEQAAPLKPHTEAQKRPMESALDGIFTEMLTGSEVFSQFMEHKSEEDALEALTTSTTDLGLCLSRLAFKVQCSKNRSAELCPTAMTQQIEELQECTELIQGQQPLFAQLKGGKAEPEEALKVLWSSALQDAAAVIQNKEVQLQLVTDYCRQIQAAKTTVDRLTAELDAMKMSPQASCQKELCLHLNASDREAVLTEQKSLQEKWKRLERTMEHALQHTNTYFQQSSNLLSDLSGLQEYLEMTKNTLETMSSSEGQWNWKDAQQLMEANAKIRGARQQYLHFRQLFEDLLVSSRWEEESKDFHHRLQEIKDKLHLTEELVSSQTKNHSNPIMEKMLTVMSDGLAWAKKTECDIECKRRKAPLLPEEVYWQFRDLKKLQSDVIAKQDQLETLVEEVVELLPSLDQAEEVPIIQTSLESLEELSRSTSEKLSQAIKDMEFALQTREKLSEQIADLDSWVVAHLQSEVSRTTDAEFRSFSKMNLRLHQIQGTLAEAERQAAVCEALLMTSRDISSELSVTETCQLYSKINNLQEDIAGIISRAKSSKEEMEELIQTTDSRKKHLAVVEKSLRQMSVDLSRYVFPITRESLQALEPWKYLMLEHKSQIDLLVPWIPQEKTSKLNSVIAELQSKIISLEIKARKHESYLNTRRCVEEIREKIHDKVKDNSRDLQETCEILLIQLPLMNRWCREAGCRLHSISPDLNPSQLIVEQQRLKQSEERLKTWESALENRIGLIACEALPEMDYQLEKRATQNFLAVIVPELQEVPSLEPNQKQIDQEYLRVMRLKKVVESKMRILEVVQQQEDKQDKESQELMDVKNGVLRECDRRMECIWQARQHLSSFTDAVRDAAQFLQDTEVSLLPPQGPAGPCRESLKETQHALASLENRFQTYVEQLQNWEAASSYLCPEEMKQLQESVLSQLLVRRATLQAQGHVQEQSLSRCVEQHANYTKSQEEILQRVRAAEERLLDLVSQKTTCLDDSNKHEEQLTALSGDTEALLRCLGELREWCPHQSCCRTREAGAAAVWRRVLDLRLCTKEVEARSKRRVSEWISVADSLEKASGILQQLEAELPEGDAFKLSSEDLHDLLQSLEQFQDRADCEHRALSGLELRTARLLGVPAHLGQAPPIPVCQQLQVMQGRYSSVKQKSKDALLSAKRELEDREKVREDLHVVSAWMEAAGRLLLAEDEDSSTQLVYGQLDAHKASLQRITESLQMKYKEKDASVPPEIESQLQEVTNALGQIESEVAEALRKSGPNYRLGVKLSDIHTGLTSVQRRLEERSSSVMDAKVTQKCVWDELDVWHSRLAALEVEVHDLEEPQEALALTEGLVEVQQLYSLLAKQAEQRTTLLSKVPAWLQQHKEMIGSCESWMVEARTWLAAPCTYTTAKCLRSHVNALQIVLKDAAQIQATLQSFTSVLTEMSQVYDTKLLQEQLDEASLQVSAVQDSFNSPLHQLEHAAAEAEAIEKEVRQMENEVADIKTLLTSPETFPSPRESRLKMIEQRIQSMRRTVAEIQKCKPGLCLPQQAEHTLSVFTVVDQLQTLLLELEKKVPALFIQQPQTPVQSKVSSRLQGSTDDTEEEQGQIRIVHFEEDPLRRSGGVLQTVEQSPPPPSRSLKPDSSEAATRADQTAAEGGRRDDEEGSVGWRLFGSFLGTPSKASAAVSEESGAEQNRELAAAGTQGPEEPQPAETQPRPRPPASTLHLCLEQVSQLELWLQSVTSAGAAMQQGVEEQLRSYQEMMREIEEKVSSLSEHSSALDPQRSHEACQREAAERLISRLELLKVKLVSFQQLLQDGHEENICGGEPEEQTKSVLKRSSSFQEIFSSPQNKLLRQSSLQQQRDLELELTQQRGLTQAVAQQGRSQLNSLESEDGSESSPWGPPPEAAAGEDSALQKWDVLHTRLLALEEGCLLPGCEVTDSSLTAFDGTAGRVFGTETLKELQASISRLKQLGSTSAQLQSEAAAQAGSRQALDEGLFDVLHRAALSLSSINTQLRSDAGVTHEDQAQLSLLRLQSLSAELASLKDELARQGSEVSRVLASERAQECIEVLCRVLAVVLTAVESRQRRLQKLQEDAVQTQKLINELNQDLHSTQITLHQNTARCEETLQEQLQVAMETQEFLQQKAEQTHCLMEEAEQQRLPVLTQQASRLQAEVDAVLGGVQCHRGKLKGNLDLQEQLERLVQGLKQLLHFGSERLTLQTDVELRSSSALQQLMTGHMKFFQFLGHHFHILQHLTDRAQNGTTQRWGAVLMELQVEVARLQQQGLEKGMEMQETSQAWSQWEEDSTWADRLLNAIQTSFSTTQWGGDCEETESQKCSAYRDLCGVMKGNQARFADMLEAGRWLQTVGCCGVGVSTVDLENRWKSLHRKLERACVISERTRTLKNMFLRDAAALAHWMSGAMEQRHRWSQAASSPDLMDVQQKHDVCLQAVALMKELEAKTELKVTVFGTASQLIHLKEAEAGLHKDEEKTATILDLHLCSINTQLKQIELDWSSLLVDLPAIQQDLFKLWMEELSPKEVLSELQSWLAATQAQLEEHRSHAALNLTEIQKYCKECLSESASRQAMLDFINQQFQRSSTEESQWWRCDCNQFAEEQGRLNQQWLHLQQSLHGQLNDVEQQLRERRDREARLQQVNSWIEEQNRCMDSAQKPDSWTEVQRNISYCQELEQKIEQKHETLQQLREDGSSGIDESTQACASLRLQTESTRQRLIQSTAALDQRAGHGETADAEIHQSAQRRLQDRLQLLRQEACSSEAGWEDLRQSVLRLTEFIDPAAAAVVSERTDRRRSSWTKVLETLDQQLVRGQDILQFWGVYSQLAGSASERLQALQTDVTSELKVGPEQETSVEQTTTKTHNIQSLLSRTKCLQSDLEGVLKASKDLVSLLDPSAATLIQSESRLLSRGVLRLGQQLSQRLGQLQEELQRLQEFEQILESLEKSLQVWHQRLDDMVDMDQSGLLELSGLSADLDVLNELGRSLTLGDVTARRLQRLNRGWADASSRAEEACSELQTEALRSQTFEQKCESWMNFLQRMEDSLAVDIAGSYGGLRQQLCIHKRFQAELLVAHQILHSVVAEALLLLQKGQVEDRSGFVLKMAQLRELWQGAVQRAAQRRSLVEGLVKHWHEYSRSLRKLQRFLSDAQTLLPPAGPARCSLQQLRHSLQELQHTELLFHRYQSTFIHTLEVGRQLFSMGDEETQSQLQMDLGALQEEWDNLHRLLGKRMELTEAIIQNWERCDAGLLDSMLHLKELRTRLNRTVPDCDGELQRAQELHEEIEDSLEDWAESLTELSTMKTDLSQYIIADDMLLLQEQVEHLHCQWEELCFKVSLRKQEVADRLNAWIIFNEKNKELCDWLVQMENKVAHTTDLNIEEMVEKLKKDCMEEMNLFSENKTHLKQLGEQLMTASNKTKEAEINNTLKDVSDRWQHLFDHIDARVRKLKETLVTVQQLDKNMSNLRTWLSRIEAELAKPVVYSVCHSDEIQRKLEEQQDLQRDIELHSESVASVLSLCDVLLHDADACSPDSENDSIQQTAHSLDRRWRNICAMSTERRMRIEETWRLWRKFLDDYSRFEDWLKTAELIAASPGSADVLYTSAKEELKRFEAFQRQVHERLTQLELVNKQYRRLARENRTDSASKLQDMVHDGNQRWDRLQRRVAAILRRLKHFTSQREEFEGSREAILVWLTEMDLQLTNVEHFSESDIEDKMRQLNAFQQEITLNTNKIDALIVFGENLIQKSTPLDAVLIEDELEELHSYCQEVFGRVARFHHRLVNRRPVLDEEKDTSDHDLCDPSEISNEACWSDSRRIQAGHGGPAAEGVPAGQQAMCHLLVPPPDRSGRETPVSVDSIPLEWDHTVDVGGSSSHEEDEDAAFFSALSVSGGKSVTDPPSWHQPGSPEVKRGALLSPGPSRGAPFHQQGYGKLMSECSGSISSLKRVKLILNDDEELEEAGLSGGSRQSGTGVIERWELLQAPKFSAETGIKPDLEPWHKLNSDLNDVTSCLSGMLPELNRLQRIAPSTSIRDIEVNAKKLKEMQKTFNSHNLNAANQSWTRACSGLESCERRLRSALLQCQEFHEELHSLLLWLSQAESKLCSVSVRRKSISVSTLMEHRDTLTALQEDLSSRQQQVSALQRISSQLLLEASGEESLEAKEKVHVVSSKLHLMTLKVSAALRSLQGRLEELGSQAATGGQPVTDRLHEERKHAPPQPHFLHRVLRAAFHLHLLFFVLLVLICLVPPSEDHYSCKLSNNFARSFQPMLHYTNGPPPT
ncbi:hypothetical protein OJAV_G00211250 [Oryzias javanicus]|uniref:KASH domain-containing protein n=1 Tax=Oryzias javanicus TaxID=123683 RepID=A0A437C2S8_ORYJA|nr:hypothetical protein OJAV_G00211250 [Oryzias javanicus]